MILDSAYDRSAELDSILFDAWRKGAVSEGAPETLARMAEGQSVAFKLTKKPATMRKIEELSGWMPKEVLRPESRDHDDRK